MLVLLFMFVVMISESGIVELRRRRYFTIFFSKVPNIVRVFEKLAEIQQKRFRVENRESLVQLTNLTKTSKTFGKLV